MNDDFDTARARRGGHTGAAVAIRAAIEEADRPLTIDALSRHTGIRPEKIKSAVRQMCAITGGIVAVKQPNGTTTYDLHGREKPAPKLEVDPDRPYARALTITIGRGAKWGAGLV